MSTCVPPSILPLVAYQEDTGSSSPVTEQTTTTPSAPSAPPPLLLPSDMQDAPAVLSKDASKRRKLRHGHGNFPGQEGDNKEGGNKGRKEADMADNKQSRKGPSPVAVSASASASAADSASASAVDKPSDKHLSPLSPTFRRRHRRSGAVQAPTLLPSAVHKARPSFPAGARTPTKTARRLADIMNTNTSTDTSMNTDTDTNINTSTTARMPGEKPPRPPSIITTPRPSHDPSCECVSCRWPKPDMGSLMGLIHAHPHLKLYVQPKDWTELHLGILRISFADHTEDRMPPPRVLAQWLGAFRNSIEDYQALGNPSPTVPRHGDDYAQTQTMQGSAAEPDPFEEPIRDLAPSEGFGAPQPACFLDNDPLYTFDATAEALSSTDSDVDTDAGTDADTDTGSLIDLDDAYNLEPFTPVFSIDQTVRAASLCGRWGKLLRRSRTRNIVTILRDWQIRPILQPHGDSRPPIPLLFGDKVGTYLKTQQLLYRRFDNPIVPSIAIIDLSPKEIDEDHQVPPDGPEMSRGHIAGILIALAQYVFRHRIMREEAEGIPPQMPQPHSYSIKTQVIDLSAIRQCQPYVYTAHVPVELLVQLERAKSSCWQTPPMEIQFVRVPIDEPRRMLEKLAHVLDVIELSSVHPVFQTTPYTTTSFGGTHMMTTRSTSMDSPSSSPDSSRSVSPIDLSLASPSFAFSMDINSNFVFPPRPQSA